MKKRKFKLNRNPVIAGLISLFVPGLGQIYAGKTTRGARIIFAAIVIANLNIIILPLIALANPDLHNVCDDSNLVWKYWIPRITHDVASFWSVIFWIWAIMDAYRVARKSKKR